MDTGKIKGMNGMQESNQNGDAGGRIVLDEREAAFQGKSHHPGLEINGIPSRDILGESGKLHLDRCSGAPQFRQSLLQRHVFPPLLQPVLFGGADKLHRLLGDLLPRRILDSRAGGLGLQGPVPRDPRNRQGQILAANSAEQNLVLRDSLTGPTEKLRRTIDHIQGQK